MKNGLRVIGGEWRGRRIPAPAGERVRPTPNRIRETLFNWLAPTIEGSRCLDLFAGTGALGIEALSRGARQVDFVDRERDASQGLRGMLNLLGASDQANVYQQDALRFLKAVQASCWDIVFVDPPFREGLLDQTLDALVPCLNPGHQVYVEHERKNAPLLPAGWRVLREKSAGQVTYRLLEFTGTSAL